MRTELIIDGNAVYEIDIDCKERHMAERGFSAGKELSQMAFPDGRKNKQAWILGLFMALALAAQGSG